MALPSNKKLSIIYILKILQEYSDEEHILTQKDIQDKLYSLYGMEVERKAVSATIDSLIDCGYDIIKTSKGSYLAQREFENYELRLLIDSVLYSKHIQTKYAKDLIDKLINQSNQYFRKTVKNVYNVNNIYRVQSPDLFLVIDELGLAIENGKQVQFTINEFGTDKLLHPIQENVIVNPYKMVYQNGFYYLIGNTNDIENISGYRIDKISNIKMLSCNMKPKEETALGVENLELYINNHPFLQTGISENIQVKLNKKDIGSLIDAFGDKIRITEHPSRENNILVNLYANSQDVYMWALLNGDKVEIVSPQHIRDELRFTLQNMNYSYSESNEDKYNSELSRVKIPLTDGPDIIPRSYDLPKYELMNSSEGYTLDLSWVDLREKEEYKSLKNIVGAIFTNNQISDFSFLLNYENLRYLKISFCNIDDSMVISKLSKLQKLHLENTDIENLFFLKNIKDLRALSLCNNYHLTDYSAIEKINSLEYLAITNEEAKFINVQKIKRKNPNIKIYIGDKNNFDYVTGINYYKDIDKVIKKDNAPLYLLTNIFGLFDVDAEEKMILNNKLTKGNEFKDALSKASSIMEENEKLILHYYIEEEKSYRDISKLLNVTIEQIVDYVKDIYRTLKHPRCSKIFIPLLKDVKKIDN